jgi:DNA helicase-2/ATP-dependent DNA helicase PcrA
MQAQAIADTVIPKLVQKRIALDEIAVLYRAAYLGDKVAEALKQAGIPFVWTDGNAIVRRSSRLARFIEDCARWVVGGWRNADPRYGRLLRQALTLVYGRQISTDEEQRLSDQLIGFLQTTIGSGDSTHAWLQGFDCELIAPWRVIARNSEQEWDICAEMIANTDPAMDLDIPLTRLAGRVDGTGRVSLSTLHSAKGREFDAVVMYGVNASDLPSERDKKSATALREARRLFYVGVTRPRKELSLIFQEHHHSPWVKELFDRSGPN